MIILLLIMHKFTYVYDKMRVFQKNDFVTSFTLLILNRNVWS